MRPRKACARSPAPTGVPAIAVATVSESQNTTPSATATTTMAAYLEHETPPPDGVRRARVPGVPLSSPASERAATATANPMRTIGASQESNSTFT